MINHYFISDSYEEKRYSLFSFELENKVLRCFSLFLGAEGPPNLGGITVLGVNHSVTKVTVNDLEQGFKYDTLNKVGDTLIIIYHSHSNIVFFPSGSFKFLGKKYCTQKLLNSSYLRTFSNVQTCSNKRVRDLDYRQACERTLIRNWQNVCF